MNKQSKKDLSMFSKEVLIGLIDYMQQALKYQKQRIDKTIEYIENKNNEVIGILENNKGTFVKKQDLLDILRGEDNDNN